MGWKVLLYGLEGGLVDQKHPKQKRAEFSFVLWVGKGLSGPIKNGQSLVLFLWVGGGLGGPKTPEIKTGRV